ENEPIEDPKPIMGVEKTLTLSEGASRQLEFPFELGRVDIGNESLFSFMRFKKDGKERIIRFVPKTAGTTTMTIYDIEDNPRISYTVRVTREDLGQITSQLEELLGDIEGLKIKSVGGTIILDGEILLPKDMIRINRVIAAMKDRDPKKSPTPIKNLTTIGKVTMNILAERIEREINSPEITARVINKNILLEGTAESEPDADRAFEIAKTYLPDIVKPNTKGEASEVVNRAQGGDAGGSPIIIDLMRVRPRQAPPPKQDIKITVNYVELDNEYQRSFNFNWRPLVSDQSSSGFDTSLGQFTANLIATVTGLLPKLYTDKTHSHARVLKQETVIVEDGADKEAAIDSSLDIYTRVVDSNGNAQLSPIQVQNSLKVKAATLPGSDSISLGLQVNLTSLVGSDNGQPIVARNSMQTKVNIKNGDSAALGGYGIDNALAGYNRDPNRSVTTQNNQNSSSPLFNLDRSKSFRHDKQQYVIFVTPEVLRTASAGTDDITRKFHLNAGER
ncbi:MAG: pilus assembly protein N-terminal domain-containing protein, partial [Deltaproteobacteria bacterium]